MNQEDFETSLMIGVISGLIVTFAGIVSDIVDNPGNVGIFILKAVLLGITTIILFVFFIVVFNHPEKREKKGFKNENKK